MGNLRSAYKHYLTYATDPVDEQTYLNIIQGTHPGKSDFMNAPTHLIGFLRYIIKLVLDGVSVMLPERCGVLYVQGKKQEIKIDPDTGEITGAAPDWPATKKLWAECTECAERKQKVYHMNEHTNNIRYKIIWSNRGMLVAHKILYSLIFTRENKRTASALFKSGKEYYVKA